MENKKKNLRSLSNHEISIFCRQLSMLTKGGVSPYECINLLISDTKDSEGKFILSKIMDILNTGERLHTAMEYSGVFPDYVIKMITLGEESGRLDTVLDSLANFYEREDELNENIRSAFTYPLVMIAIMIVVVFVILSKVMPIFADVFSQLGTAMNAFSESLVALGRSINNYSVILIVIITALVCLAVYLVHGRGGKKFLLLIAQKLPVTGKLYRDIAAGRFASGMALTLASGMDTYRSLDIVADLVENKDISSRIENAKKLIREDGMTFPEALEKTEIFSQLYTRMILVGFKSGAMDVSFRETADHYTIDTDRRIYGIISVIEPTLVIILSIIVGLILLSVIMPLMGIMSSIG